MNSEANDSTDATVSNEETDTLESIAETSGETRTDRIRRLNRERQRRRREKLRMSRQSEAPSTSSNDVDPSHDLEMLSDGCAIVEVMLPVKVETEVTEESQKPLPKTTRPKRSTRIRHQARKEASLEQITSDSAPSANNAISPPCHDNNARFSGASDESGALVVASEVEVVEEKPQENGTGEPIEDSDMRADGKRRRTRDSGKRQGEKSFEDVSTKRVYYREREKKKRQGMSHDEVTARREKQRELKRKQKERMSNEQVEALRARYREWRRKRKETMTNEQLEIIRRGNRERQRRRRERLGIRKRSTTPQAKGVSEAVIQGIKNKQTHVIKPLETSLSPEASLVAAVNQVASLNSAEAAAATAALLPNPSRVDGPVAVTVEVNQAVAGVATGVIQSTQSVAPPPSSTPNLSSLPVSTTTVTQGTLPPPVHVLGPQGTIIPGLPPGSGMQGALYSMPMSGIQGTLLSGIPISAGQPLTGVQGGAVNVAGMPFSNMQGIMSAMPTQGAFLSGLQASQAGVLPGMQTFSSMAPTMTKDGQILHSISTLLPIAPVQGIQAPGQGVTFLAPMPMPGTGQVQTFPDIRSAVTAPIRSQSPGVGSVLAAVPVPEPVALEATATVTPSEESEHGGQDPKGKSQTPPKPKGRRGRKRTTSAAEMLANLSNLPPSNTPMSSMLSALASQVREHTSGTAGPDKEAEPPNRRAAVEPTQAASSKRPAPPTELTQTGAVFHGSPITVTEPAVRASVVTYPEATGTFPGAASQNTTAKIPHMSTFLTTMGNNSIPGMSMPFPSPSSLPRPLNPLPPGMQSMPGQLYPARVSVAVETEEIEKTTVGTNTDNGGEVIPGLHVEHTVVTSSVGTMTDSLYRVSVGTVTGQTAEQSSCCNVSICEIQHGSDMQNSQALADGVSHMAENPVAANIVEVNQEAAEVTETMQIEDAV